MIYLVNHSQGSDRRAQKREQQGGVLPKQVLFANGEFGDSEHEIDSWCVSEQCPHGEKRSGFAERSQCVCRSKLRASLWICFPKMIRWGEDKIDSCRDWSRIRFSVAHSWEESTLLSSMLGVRRFEMHEITEILRRMSDGNGRQNDELFQLVYDELRKIASRQLSRESLAQTWQPTALVNEAYLRLVGPSATAMPTWENRRHFFAAATEAMRRICVDSARKKNRLKRGAGAKKVPLHDDASVDQAVDEELLELDEALERFEKIDPQKASLVKLRFFGGLTNDDAAAILEISSSTAERYWAYSRAWLKREIELGS